MKKFLLPVLLITMVSCDMELELQNNDDTFTINEGSHSTDHPFRGFDGNSINFEAKFHTCAQYTCKDPKNQADINKLMGFSSCNTHHHQNSARVGWRWYNNQMEIFAYVYDNGNRIEEFITAVPVGEYNQYSITRNQQGYLFKVNETKKQILTTSTCSGTANYMLWPYFGGDETAPHDITIKAMITEGVNQDNNPVNSNG